MTARTGGWTLDTLKEYLESIAVNGDDALRQHIISQKESVALALDSLKQLLDEKDKYIEKADERAREAITKADKQMETRLEGMNEFRNQITSERGSYITRDLHAAAMEQVQTLADRNRDELNKRLSKEVFDNTITQWTTWRGDIDTWRAAQAGKGEGVSSTAKIIMATLTALSLMVGIIAISLTIFDRTGSKPGPIPVTITNPAAISLSTPHDP